MFHFYRKIHKKPVKKRGYQHDFTHYGRKEYGQDFASGPEWSPLEIKKLNEAKYWAERNIVNLQEQFREFQDEWGARQMQAHDEAILNMLDENYMTVQ